MDDIHDTQSRRRKGSLRKTVLLGVERLRLDRRSPDDNTPPPKKLKSPSRSVFELPSANSSTESYTAPSSSDRLATSPTGADSEASAPSVTSPASTADASNEEDDEVSPALAASAAAFSRPSASPSPPSSDASAPNETSPLRRNAKKTPTQQQSPLAALPHPPPLPPIEEEWDYAETAWWGWVILAVTWAVFVVGMGSTFEVWSWAWDVGQTPYAPPELEDDPTLPIVGYYPALFVLTAVMSWIWVMVAWMGLKYFKHAKGWEFEGS